MSLVELLSLVKNKAIAILDHDRNLKSENKSLVNRVLQLSAQIAEKDQAIANLSEQIASLQNELGRVIQQDKVEDEMVIATYEQRLQDAQVALKDAQAKAQVSEQEAKAAQDGLTAYLESNQQSEQLAQELLGLFNQSSSDEEPVVPIEPPIELSPEVPADSLVEAVTPEAPAEPSPEALPVE
jgi:chromosome segregation ATPase